jgi:hypothetical protein
MSKTIANVRHALAAMGQMLAERLQKMRSRRQNGGCKSEYPCKGDFDKALSWWETDAVFREKIVNLCAEETKAIQQADASQPEDSQNSSVESMSEEVDHDDEGADMNRKRKRHRQGSRRKRQRMGSHSPQPVRPVPYPKAMGTLRSSLESELPSETWGACESAANMFGEAVQQLVSAADDSSSASLLVKKVHRALARYLSQVCEELGTPSPHNFTDTSEEEDNGSDDGSAPGISAHVGVSEVSQSQEGTVVLYRPKCKDLFEDRVESVPALSADEQTLYNQVAERVQKAIPLQIGGLDNDSMATLIGSREDGQLNDTIVDRYLALLHDRDNRIGLPDNRVVFLSSFFYATWTASQYEGVKKWLKHDGAQALGLKAIIIPIFMHKHWMLGIINVQCRQFEVYDSMRNAERAREVCEVIVASR